MTRNGLFMLSVLLLILGGLEDLAYAQPTPSCQECPLARQKGLRVPKCGEVRRMLDNVIKRGAVTRSDHSYLVRLLPPGFVRYSENFNCTSQELLPPTCGTAQYYWHCLIDDRPEKCGYAGLMVRRDGSIIKFSQPGAPATPEDPKKAEGPSTEELAKIAAAAEKGDPESQYRLGLMYRDGLGVPADAEKAGEWFYKAAVGGSQEARKELERAGIKVPGN